MALWIGRHCPDVFEDRKYSEGRAEMPYRLFVPEGSSARGVSRDRSGPHLRRGAGPGAGHPLVLYLHGASARGRDNARPFSRYNALGAGFWALPEVQRRHPCFVLVPQCPRNDKWVAVRRWDLPSHVQPRTATRALTMAVRILDRVQAEFNVDPRRVYLVGQSMGAYGAWDLAARMPERFAAVVVVSGGADESTAPRLAGKPLWVFHGDADETVPVERSRSMVEALSRLQSGSQRTGLDAREGGAPRYTEYAGAGHLIFPYVFLEPGLADWLFARTLPRE